MKRKFLVVVLTGVLIWATATTALAGHETTGVLSYTGCLATGDGVMIKIKQGEAPKSPCTGGQVQAHFSGGDITKISVGSGLQLPLGGDNGEVRIALAAGQTFPSGCTGGDVVEWNGSAWVCGTDNDTTYSASTGLDLSAGNAFSIEPAYRVRNDTDCGTGQFATGFSDAGQIACSAPPATASGIEVWQGSAGTKTLPKGEGVDLIQMVLPAGTYLMTAHAVVADAGVGLTADDEVAAQCKLRDANFNDLPVVRSGVNIGDGSDSGPQAPAVVHGVLTLAAANTVRFTCTASGGDSNPDRAEGIVMTAVKVGTVH